MSDQTEFKVVIIGDGTKPYKWEAFRRSNIQTNWPASGFAKGACGSRADCIAEAYEKARAKLEEERFNNTKEEIEFDVELEPLDSDPDVLEDIPVVDVDPDPERRMEKRNDRR